MWNFLESNTTPVNNQEEDRSNIITVPVEPLSKVGSGFEDWYRKPISNNTIRQINSLDREEMINNPEVLDGIRSILDDDGAGQLAYEYTPEDAVKHFYTWGRNVDSSDIGFLREGKKAWTLAKEREMLAMPKEEMPRYAERILENERKLKNFNAALDMWEKVDNIGDSAKKGNWTEVGGALAENTFNVLNPAESPTTYGPAAIFGLGRRLLWWLGGKKAGIAIGKKYLTGEGLERSVKSRLMKDLGYYAATDGITGLGMDQYFQRAMINVGRQDDWNYYQTGFMAVTGMIASGVKLMAEMPNHKKLESFGFGYPGFYTNLEMTNTEKRQAHKRISIRAAKLNELWQKRTQGGKVLLNPANSEKHVDFLHFFLNGYTDPKDSSKNITGIFQTLYDSLGVSYLTNLRNKKGQSEFMKNLTYMLDEVIDPTTKKELSAQLKAMDRGGAWKKSILEGDPTVRFDNRTKTNSYFDVLLRTMAQTASRGGLELGLIGNWSKKFYGDPAKLVADNLTDKQFLSKWRKGKGFSNYWQLNWKRAVITNFTTSVYNLGGWLSTNVVNVGSDMTLLALHSWAAPGKLMYNVAKKGMTGNKDIRPLADALNTSKNLFFNQKARLKAIVNPNATSKMVEQFLKLDPKSADVLNKYLGGGFEAGQDLADVALKIGSVEVKMVDGKRVVVPKITQTIKTTEDILALGRVIMMTDVIDSFTKSQSFLVNLDRALREVMPDANTLKDNKGIFALLDLSKEELNMALKGDYFFDAMGQAVEATQKDIFSKTYSGKNQEWMYGISDSKAGRNVPGVKVVGDAGSKFMEFTTEMIEEVGNIPVLGVHFPFGRFFNNMMAFSWDAMGGGSPAMLIELMKTGRATLETQRRAAKAIWTGGGGITLGVISSQLEKIKDPLNLHFLKKIDVFDPEWQKKHFESLPEGTWQQHAKDLYEAIKKLDGSTVLDIGAKMATEYLKTPGRLLLEGTGTYSMLAQCIKQDKDKLKLGLAWDEVIWNGRPTNIRYHFPLSQCHAAARAYNVKTSLNRDGTPSDLDPEMWRDLFEQFALGSVTRQLKSGSNINNIIWNMVNDDFEGIEEKLAILGRATVQNYFSGATRVAAPIQTIVDASQTDPDSGLKQTVPDKKDLEALVWNSSRYFNNILDALGLNVVDLVGGDSSKVIKQSSKTRDTDLSPIKSTYSGMGDLFGVKGVAPKSSMELLLAKANMAVYPINKPSAPGHDEVLNSIIAPLLEDRAFSLRTSKEFVRASIGERKQMVQGMLEDASEDLDKKIFGGIVNTNIRPNGISGNESMASFLKKIRQIQKVAKLKKDDRRSAIRSLNTILGDGHPLKIDPTIKPDELFKLIQNDVFADNNYLKLLLEEHKKLTRGAKKEGVRFNLRNDYVVRDSTGEVFNEWGEVIPLEKAQ